MSKQQWQKDLEKDWPVIMKIVSTFTPTGWVCIAIAALFFYWVMSSWFALLIFIAGLFVGYAAREVHDQLEVASRKDTESRHEEGKEARGNT